MATKKDLENQIAELRKEKAGLRIRAEKSGRHRQDAQDAIKRLGEARAENDGLRARLIAAQNKPAKVETKTVFRDRPVEVIVEKPINVPVEVIKEVEKIVKVPVEVEVPAEVVKVKPCKKQAAKIERLEADIRHLEALLDKERSTPAPKPEIKVVTKEVPVDKIVYQKVPVDRAVDRIVYKPRPEDAAEIARLTAELDKMRREYE